MKVMLMTSLIPRFCSLALVMTAMTHGWAADEPLTRVQIARIGKAATALVEVKAARGQGFGSAFCIHPDGWFVTNAHVAQGEIKLVLNPSLKTEKVYAARVVRSDTELDLALLHIEGVKDLPVLALGSDERLEEQMDAMAFGFPLVESSARGREGHPSISVNAGSITALRRQDDRLKEIQLDAELNPGNSGGPVLDNHGKVIGVVRSGLVARGLGRTGMNLAIPVSTVARFLARPEVQFTAPRLGPAALHKPATFEARVTPLLPSSAPLTVDLVLKAGKGPERTLRMEAQGDRYRVTALPIPGRAEPRMVRLVARFDNATLEAMTTERSFKIGGRDVALGDVRNIHPGSPPSVVLQGGETIAGTLVGLEALPAQLGGQTMSVDLGSAKEVNVSAPDATEDLAYTVVVRQGDTEIYRQTLGHRVYLCDLQETNSSVGFGVLGKNGDLGYDPGGGAGRGIIVKGVPATKGLSMHSTAPPAATGYSFARYRLDGKYTSFHSAVAVNDSVRVAPYPGNGMVETPLTFSVVGDGRVLWRSRPLQRPGESEPCIADVTGVLQLEVRVTHGGGGAAHAVWVDPYVQ
jgi:hypothetical protein